MFALRHLVQTATRLGAPPTITRIFWMLGFQRRRVRLWEWEMLFPNPGVLPHTSQTEAIGGTGYLKAVSSRKSTEFVDFEEKTQHCEQIPWDETVGP